MNLFEDGWNEIIMLYKIQFLILSGKVHCYGCLIITFPFGVFIPSLNVGKGVKSQPRSDISKASSNCPDSPDRNINFYIDDTLSLGLRVLLLL